jgi:hypothetical protein
MQPPAYGSSINTPIFPDWNIPCTYAGKGWIEGSIIIKLPNDPAAHYCIPPSNLEQAIDGMAREKLKASGQSFTEAQVNEYARKAFNAINSEIDRLKKNAVPKGKFIAEPKPLGEFGWFGRNVHYDAKPGWILSCSPSKSKPSSEFTCFMGRKDEKTGELVNATLSSMELKWFRRYRAWPHAKEIVVNSVQVGGVEYYPGTGFPPGGIGFGMGTHDCGREGTKNTCTQCTIRESKLPPESGGGTRLFCPSTIPIETTPVTEKPKPPSKPIETAPGARPIPAVPRREKGNVFVRDQVQKGEQISQCTFGFDAGGGIDHIACTIKNEKRDPQAFEMRGKYQTNSEIEANRAIITYFSEIDGLLTCEERTSDIGKESITCDIQ